MQLGEVGLVVLQGEPGAAADEADPRCCGGGGGCIIYSTSNIGSRRRWYPRRNLHHTLTLNRMLTLQRRPVNPSSVVGPLLLRSLTCGFLSILYYAFFAD